MSLECERADLKQRNPKDTPDEIENVGMPQERLLTQFPKSL